MEGKKISFGFTKTKTANKPLIVEKKEYIDCVEEKSIKIVGYYQMIYILYFEIKCTVSHFIYKT